MLGVCICYGNPLMLVASEFIVWCGFDDVCFSVVNYVLCVLRSCANGIFCYSVFLLPYVVCGLIRASV